MGTVIGNGVGIPFSAPFSWASYWTTLISATVEDATPDEVALTFSASNSAVASDFTIAGFTISNGSWCGSVLTLVLSTEVLYGDLLVINYVPTSKTQSITNNTISYHYVDVFAGDNGNDGSITSPWETVAYADTQLSTNAPLKLKYPDGTWHKSPAYWHTLRAFFPMVAGADTSKVYDVANGIIGTITGNVTYSGTKYTGISLENSGYVNLGTGVLGIGTGDQTILATVYPTSAAVGPFVIISNGSIGVQKGYSLYYSSGKAGYQMRSAATNIPILGSTVVFDPGHPTPQVIVSTVKRNDVSGMKIYVDGVSDASAVDTTGLGTTDLTNATVKTIIGAREISGVTAYYLSALWIKELRIYSSELDQTNAIAASNEATATMNTDYAFGSGSFISTGIDSVFDTSVNIHLGISANITGPFFPIPQLTYTGAPTPEVGNTLPLALNELKCNGTIPPCSGEINWILIHESVNKGLPPYLAKSHNGIDWEYIRVIPGLTPSVGMGQGCWVVDNDDPSDYTNIHLITFGVNPGRVYEAHPTNAQFTEWSDVVLIFDPSITYIYNPTIFLVNGVWNMFFSAWVATHHYMYQATCTYGHISETNDWAVVQTGDWAGLGETEGYTFFNTSGTTWILIYFDLTSNTWKYSTSNDNCATWSAGTLIRSLTYPLQYNALMTKLT